MNQKREQLKKLEAQYEEAQSLDSDLSIDRIVREMTELDKSAKDLREKVYAAAGNSFDEMLKLAKSDKIADRTRIRVHGAVVKMAHRDMHEMAKLQLEREKMLLEADSAQRDRDSKERIAERDQGGGRPQFIVRLDTEAGERARGAAREQERLRSHD